MFGFGFGEETRRVGGSGYRNPDGRKRDSARHDTLADSVAAGSPIHACAVPCSHERGRDCRFRRTRRPLPPAQLGDSQEGVDDDALRARHHDGDVGIVGVLGGHGAGRAGIPRRNAGGDAGDDAVPVWLRPRTAALGAAERGLRASRGRHGAHVCRHLLQLRERDGQGLPDADADALLWRLFRLCARDQHGRRAGGPVLAGVERHRHGGLCHGRRRRASAGCV